VNPRPTGGSSQIAGSIFLLEPNVFDRGILQEALGQAFPLHHFKQESSLLAAYERLPRPMLTIVSWDSIRRSTSILKRILGACFQSPVLLLCHSHDLDSATVAARIGIAGILQLPMSSAELQQAIRKHLPHLSLQASANQLNPDELTLPDGTLFLCCNENMRLIKKQAALVAPSDIPVLILGESGTGKEVLAKYVHAMSTRSKGIFLKVNCAAVPGELLESEFFGHEKGAFTGAVTTVQGKFELCAGGTIFLDEIGEMPASLQAKLLHVLQDGTYTRLGSGAPLTTNVRVIAATNINMKSAIAARTFREDLYYRLSGFTMTALPLRDRKEEIPAFAMRFMKKAAGKYKCAPLMFSDALLAALQRHKWPGNLRELENVVSRYLVLRDEQPIIAELESHIIQMPAGTEAADFNGESGLRRQLRRANQAAESIAIAKALEETGWNRKAAARNMRISYTSLLHKIKLYELAMDLQSKRPRSSPMGRTSTSSNPVRTSGPHLQILESKPPTAIRSPSSIYLAPSLTRAASGK
jgi:two-component system, NtrC family, response regulator AtoC